MKTIKIVRIEVPHPWLNNKFDGERNRLFISNFIIEASRLELPVTFVTVPWGAEEAPRYPRTGELVCSYHSHIVTDHTQWKTETSQIRLKEAPIPPLYSIDTHGYSGWSSILYEPNLRNLLNSYEFEDFKSTIDFYRDQILSGKSKYNQPPRLNALLENKKPYILFPLQVQNDSVSSFAIVNTLSLIKRACDIAKLKKIRIIFKPHPFDRGSGVKELLNEIAKSNEFIEIVNSDITELINNSIAVVSVNSGSSFESLVLNKPTWNSGKSEWWMAVNQINSLQDLDKVINLDQPRPSIFQQKVIGFLLKYYWVRNDDNLNINRKINECLSRIEKLNNLYLESSLIPDPDDLLYHKMSSEILKIYATNQELKRQIDLLISELLGVAYTQIRNPDSNLSLLGRS